MNDSTKQLASVGLTQARPNQFQNSADSLPATPSYLAQLLGPPHACMHVGAPKAICIVICDLINLKSIRTEG